jgi:capsular polysaccharide biosynthesis protein
MIENVKLLVKPKKIYLRRAHIIHNGTVMGESYLNHLLMENGYESVAPEEYSVAEQASLLLNPDHVVFMEGSPVYPVELLPNLGSRVTIDSSQAWW